ncbi:MAG TPA: S41 family peptidase [Gemmatimonadaceae bacterium]
MRCSSHAVAATLFVVCAAGPLVAQDSLRAATRHRTIAEDLQLFSQVLNQIRVNHPDSIDTHELLMSAIEGMVAAADPHSYVIPAARLDPAKEAALYAGKLFPVPVAFQFIEGAPLVVAVAPGSKAVSLNILPGDELVAIDGRPVGASSASELDIVLAGNKGSAVKLAFRRRRADGSIARLEHNVVRERIEEESAVPVATLIDSTTGYVRVTTFMGDKVADDLHDALGRLEGKGMRRLVLDLRGNGGGRVDEAKRIAGEFLPRGAIVYTASGRKADVTDTGRVQRSFWRSERRYPIVVLVDEGTASASELVAGALQDHDRALIVGGTTFGKSLLMQTFPLSDGSRMSLVIGQVRTPCGRVIQREYHTESRRAYYRDAGQADSTADRPSCKTDAGRVVFGGGGIVPDVRLTKTPTPGWLITAGERGLVMSWAAGFVDKPNPITASVDALAAVKSLDAATLSDFKSYAASNGITIPSDADATLGPALMRSIAFAKFGAPGYYRLVALTDPGVRGGVNAFEQASRLLGAPPRN